MVQNSSPELRGLFLFRAPRHGRVTPAVVPPGAAWVEVILEGLVEPPPECDDDAPAGTGTIIWNLAGERTVHRTPPDRLYTALAFVFAQVPQHPRPAPRRTQWEDVPSLRAFTTEVLQAKHAGTWRHADFHAYVWHRLRWVAKAAGDRAARHLPHGLERVLARIEAEPGGDLSLRRLAQEAGVSVSCLCDLFRRHLGTTAHDHITQYRLEQAKHLLTSSDLLVKEVAQATGFGSTSLFCRHFRRGIGETPEAYRQRARGKPAVGVTSRPAASRDR